ncbi:hypothetical protein BDR07DRAFT_1461383 [Suillus spraguei]|nr:hypothetical protein BDR07DRAFT_1461383 [Suillus spraguei]
MFNSAAVGLIVSACIALTLLLDAMSHAPPRFLTVDPEQWKVRIPHWQDKNLGTVQNECRTSFSDERINLAGRRSVIESTSENRNGLYRVTVMPQVNTSRNPPEGNLEFFAPIIEDRVTKPATVCSICGSQGHDAKRLLLGDGRIWEFLIGRCLLRQVMHASAHSLPDVREGAKYLRGKEGSTIGAKEQILEAHEPESGRIEHKSNRESLLQLMTCLKFSWVNNSWSLVAIQARRKSEEQAEEVGELCRAKIGSTVIGYFSMEAGD